MGKRKERRGNKDQNEEKKGRKMREECKKILKWRRKKLRTSKNPEQN